MNNIYSRLLFSIVMCSFCEQWRSMGAMVFVNMK